MSTAQKLILDALADVLKRKEQAIKTKEAHAKRADEQHQLAALLTEEEVDLRRDLEAVRHAAGPKVSQDERCSLRLTDGRNEIRCWGMANHEGPCT